MLKYIYIKRPRCARGGCDAAVFSPAPSSRPGTSKLERERGTTSGRGRRTKLRPGGRLAYPGVRVETHEKNLFLNGTEKKAQKTHQLTALENGWEQSAGAPERSRHLRTAERHRDADDAAPLQPTPDAGRRWHAGSSAHPSRRIGCALSFYARRVFRVPFWRWTGGGVHARRGVGGPVGTEHGRRRAREDMCKRL